MHALVRAVLLRVGRQDPLMLNPQAEPPHIERRQAVQRRGGEGHAVVGAHRARQAVLAEQPIEDRAHADAARRQQAVARQQEARVLVGDRQRIAVDPVTGAELAFEVRRPEIVRARGHRGHDARMVWGPAPAALLHEPVPRQ